MNLADHLRIARALIDTPQKWRQGLTDDTPMCLVEAINEAFCRGSTEASEHRDACLQSLGLFNVDQAVEFNDAAGTTHADVMKLLDRAIELASTPPTPTNPESDLHHG